ncbi:MAG: copper resistance protein B [Aquirhabdus sp.]
MKLINRKYSLLALLIFNPSAWSMDHSGMDMSSMSHMDMSMPMHERHQTNAKPSSKKTQLKAKPHIAGEPKPVVKKSAPTVQEMPNMDHNAMSMNHDMDLSKMDHGAMQMNHAMPTQSMDHHDMSAMPMATHIGHMDNMQGGKAPADARSSDYSQGRNFGPIHPPMMMGNDPLMSLAVNRLEWAHNGDSNQAAYELQGWWGDDWNRAVLKAEGKISNQSLADARTELLWRKPLSTFWNTELGVRQDSGNVHNRTWLALGINGISPYWLDLDATFYVRDQSQTALILNAKYDWHITQSWVLQPRVEISFYGKNDLANDIGQGLSEVQSGLRLRYDINHQFAPYIGVEVNHHYGKTADLMAAKGEQSSQTFAVMGVAFWF